MKEMIKELIREEMMRAMSKQYFFMCGLPRAGSTLLSSILNQNPKIYSGPSSPVVPTMLTLENALANDELFRAYPKNQQAAKIIASVIDNYYSDIDKQIIIDKNRSWVNRIHYITGYFGINTPKILCPVRNIDEILASFINLRNKNPIASNGKLNFIDEMLVKNNIPLTDDNRCEFLASPNGILGQSYFGLQQAIMEGKQKYLHFIEYGELVKNPTETMQKIYEFLEIEYFEHNFEKIENVHQELDEEVYGLKGMHDVRNNLNKASINPLDILTENTLSKCKNLEFWRNLEELNVNNIENDASNNVQDQTESYDNMLEDSKIIGA